MSVSKADLIFAIERMAERLEEAAEQGGLSDSACKERAVMLRRLLAS